ncbi:MAG: hypothetical protein J1F22_02865 [Lachnospiraceae bacterium]|nr:hypothetical protein [Lachnospiraceae bacterium]
MSTYGKMDYTKEEHFLAALEHFGGKDFLQENFPNMLQMLYNTREWHQELNRKNEDEPVGYEDSFEIMELCQSDTKNERGESGTSIVSLSNMSLVNKASFLQISSVVKDPVNGVIFASSAVHDTNRNNLENPLTVDSKLMSYTKSPKVLTVSDFMAASKVNGKSVCVANTINRTLEIDLANGKPDITNIVVNQPAPKNEQAFVIRVVYNGRTDNDASYNFKMATDWTSGGVRYVRVFFPFSITVNLDDDFQFCNDTPVSFGDDFMVSLASEVVQGGSVHFNTATPYIDKIKSTIDGNTLTLDFSYQADTDFNYWGIEMPLTLKQAEGVFDFHLQFTVNYAYKDNPGEILHTPILVTSEEYPESQNMVKIKQARILWGCLGKDTQLLTEDGYRNISEVKPGDKLYTNKGYIRLKNMVTGTEEKIVAVAVSEEKTLLLTKKHPIATERGIIYADGLTIGDKLKMEDGSLREIYYLEIKDYHDKVYCPELEESALIAADGIMVGDYMTKVDVVEEPEEELEPLEPELMDELIRWSEWKEQKMKEEHRKEVAK